MTSVNVTENKYSVSVTEGATTVVTVKAPGPQGPGFPDGNLGDVTSSNTGASVVVNSGAITNAKVNDSAAIAGTKISPDFGSQNITTTGNAVFGGNLTVSGSVTTIDSTTLRVEDKNIELGKVGSPTDITADGGGITLLGDTNHTFNWVNATDSWTSSEHIALPDNKKLQLGDSQDLQLFHDGSDSKIINKTGNLLIEAKDSETGIKVIPDGAVQLYFDNNIKFTTEGTGVKVFGMLVPSASNNHPLGIDVLRWNGLFMSSDIDLLDNNKLKFGDNDDLQIFHDSNNSFIQNTTGSIYIRPKTGEDGIRVNPDNGVQLYHDNVKILQTQSWGTHVFGSLVANGDIKVNQTSGRLRIGTNDEFTIRHNSTNLIAENTVGNIHLRPKTGEEGIKLIPDGSVELYHDNVKRAETTATGFNVEGTVTCDDILLANSITHEGQTNTKISFDATSMNFVSNGVQRFSVTQFAVFMAQGFKLAFIASSGENPSIKSGGTNNGDLLIESGTDSMAQFKRDGAVELFFDGVKRFETSNSGITVQGSVTTEDMNMSNLNGTANEVDNTKGSWSIQEGADDLFIINRVSGKKYKFNLTEIS